MRVGDVEGIDLYVKSSISVSRAWGPRDSPAALLASGRRGGRDAPPTPLGAPSARDKDAPLAAFGTRVAVKVDVASWPRADPHPRLSSAGRPHGVVSNAAPADSLAR